MPSRGFLSAFMISQAAARSRGALWSPSMPVTLAPDKGLAICLLAFIPALQSLGEGKGREGECAG